MLLPKRMHWLFWELDPKKIDLNRDADYVIARIVENGMLAEVQWLISKYGLDRIHEFFRSVGHPELSARTVSFWRAFFKAGDERWAEPPNWRKASSVPWRS